MEEYLINKEHSSIRLDKAIALLNPDLSRMAIQRLIDTKKITVNDKEVKASYKTKIR